jgi:hypothetical protein
MPVDAHPSPNHAAAGDFNDGAIFGGFLPFYPTSSRLVPDCPVSN